MQRQFTIACAEHETEELLAAANHLEQQLQQATAGGQALSLERCAVIAGLNISHSLLQLQKATREQQAAQTRLQNLHDRVARMVEKTEKTENSNHSNPADKSHPSEQFENSESSESSNHSEPSEPPPESWR